jgi:hypothetical protein
MAKKVLHDINVPTVEPSADLDLISTSEFILLFYLFGKPRYFCHTLKKIVCDVEREESWASTLLSVVQKSNNLQISNEPVRNQFELVLPTVFNRSLAIIDKVIAHRGKRHVIDSLQFQIRWENCKG